MIFKKIFIWYRILRDAFYAYGALKTEVLKFEKHTHTQKYIKP